MSKNESSPKSSQQPSWSIRIATVSGIPLRIHFTFFLFLAWISVASSGNQGIPMVLFLLAIFLCVMLHELGHALVARRMGITTKDITLYPIGGIAMLEGRPAPRQEFWIALAGPLVNILIAAILAVGALIFEGGFGRMLGDLKQASMLDSLLIANLTLAGFNLIPAFPMDGGRVLRSALALRMPEDSATQIAGGIGQGLAILLGLVGIFSQGYVLILIAFFVFFGASQEVSSTVTRSFLHGHTVADAMQTRFRTILSGDTMQTAANMLLDGSQHDFPVMYGEEVLGLLLRNSIVQGLAVEGPDGYVASRMDREFKVVPPDFPLESVSDLFNQADTAPILIMRDDHLVGMLTMENLGEFVMLEHAKAQNMNRQA